MKILSQSEVEQLKELVFMEAELINLAFSRSQSYGLMILSNILTSFKELYLTKTYGDVIPSMCTEYRVFIVELLKLISDDYKENVLSELLIPKVKEINDEELLDLLINKK